jgi:hypothetical protein
MKNKPVMASIVLKFETEALREAFIAEIGSDCHAITLGIGSERLNYGPSNMHVTQRQHEPVLVFDTMCVDYEAKQLKKLSS